MMDSLEILAACDLEINFHMTLTFNNHITSLTQLDVCICQLTDNRLQQFLKNPLFTFSNRKALITNFFNSILYSLYRL